MAFSCAKMHHLIIAIFACCLLLAPPLVSPAAAYGTLKHRARIRARLRRLNKAFVKTIQSSDGDIIDCVPSHLQPAFDHPRLRGQRPLVAPERPKGYNRTSSSGGSEMDGSALQAWASSGESCPEGTVPIRRTTQEDIKRADSVREFGRKPAAAARRLRRDSTGAGHEHAIGYITGDQFYGAKASLNVWAPKVSSGSEFSLSQIWVISGSFGHDLNTIEAGWQVSPQLYGDNRPRFFTYWTSDAYRTTGCYNLLCSGFVQTNNKIAIGAAISPASAFNGAQFDINLLVWKIGIGSYYNIQALGTRELGTDCTTLVVKVLSGLQLILSAPPIMWSVLKRTVHLYLSDPKHGNWWLEFGSGVIVGYWPSLLFTHLARHANMVQFGGEVVNTGSPSGFVHTSTQMGSGRFAAEGFRRASYFRNLQIVDWDNSLIPLSNLRLLADHPNCYSIQGGTNHVWGDYFYYGGPGKNVRCP